MKRPLHIRIISGFMLLLFAFSITPKEFLHDTFAGHTDTQQTRDSKSPFQVDPAGYHCDKDGLVATSPFVAEETVAFVYTFIPFSPYTPGKETLRSADKVYCALRGPPHVNSFA